MTEKTERKKLFKDKKWAELNQGEKYMRIAAFLIGAGIFLMIGSIFPMIIIYTVFFLMFKLILITTQKIHEIEDLGMVTDEEEKKYNKEQLKRILAIIGLIITSVLLILVGRGIFAIIGAVIYYFVDKKKHEKDPEIDIGNGIEESGIDIGNSTEVIP